MKFILHLPLKLKIILLKLSGMILISVMLSTCRHVNRSTEKERIPSYSANLSKDIRQPVTGWGCFPGWVDWGAKIGEDTALQAAIYRDLGMTVARLKIMPEYCNPDGSLNTAVIDRFLVRQIETMYSFGLSKWIITTWSPPTFMKTINDPEGNVNGVPNRLKPESEDAFVDYYARVLVYLRDVKKLGTPVYAAIQNEPDYAAPWDGCKYEPEQWLRVIRKFRKALDHAGLSEIKIHGTDHNHHTIGKFFGKDLSALTSDPELLDAIDGVAFHSYDEGTESGGAMAVEARSLILKFKNELKKGAEIWQTENSTVKPEELTISAIRQLRSMMRDIAYLEANCYLYWLGSSDRKNYDGEELIFNGNKTKLYHVFRKLWHLVVPGKFSVRTFENDDDPDLSCFGPDPLDMIAFSSDDKTVVLLTNPEEEDRNLEIKGLPGRRMSVFRTSGTEDMADIGEQRIRRGAAAVLLKSRSILILETDGGIER